MDISVMNRSFSVIDIIDSYESLLWIDRFQEPGEFELYTPVTERLLTNCVQGNYLTIKESDHVQIIEDIRIETNIETGEHIRITGRSLESILDRRIVWQMTNINSYLQNGVKRILNENIISPSIAGRRISNFIMKDSTDSKITSLKLDKQYTGTNILELLKELSLENEIGYKVTLNSSNQFVFELYTGVDRSYNQSSYPYVCFSPGYDNIINSNYADITNEMKNVALVAGEDEGSQRRTRTVGTTTGLDRRELFVDARDIQSEVDDGEDEEGQPVRRELTPAEYNALLDSRGKEKLSELTEQKTFDGQVETTKLYKYDEDFFMGDVVQIENEYKIEGRARVIEFIWSQSTSGLEQYPTFRALED